MSGKQIISADGGEMIAQTNGRHVMDVRECKSAIITINSYELWEELYENMTDLDGHYGDYVEREKIIAIAKSGPNEYYSEGLRELCRDVIDSTTADLISLTPRQLND